MLAADSGFRGRNCHVGQGTKEPHTFSHNLQKGLSVLRIQHARDVQSLRAIAIRPHGLILIVGLLAEVGMQRYSCDVRLAPSGGRGKIRPCIPSDGGRHRYQALVG